MRVFNEDPEPEDEGFSFGCIIGLLISIALWLVMLYFAIEYWIGVT